MSGPVVGEALRSRFESVRRSEINRLEKKLRGMTDGERQCVEAITIEVVRGLSRGAERALAGDIPRPAIEALIRLFALQEERTS